MKSTITRILLLAVAAVGMSVSFVACAQEGAEEKQEESVFEVKQGETIDPTMAKAGLDIFDTKCSACHKYDERYVGPALGKVATRRTPEYIMNMILDTEVMIENDDTVKCLMQEFLMRMPNQSVDEKDARNILEHLREKAR
jgi:mono/diheme cytochrome c family protein